MSKADERRAQLALHEATIRAALATPRTEVERRALARLPPPERCRRCGERPNTYDAYEGWLCRECAKI